MYRRLFQRRDDPIGIDLVLRIACDQHDRATVDQFLETRMMIEFVRQGRAGDDQRLAGLHAGENAGAPRREAFIQRIAERVDLAEQAEYLAIGRNKTTDNHVVRDPKLRGAGMKLFFDLVDATNEGTDIDDQWLEPALFQECADIEQRVGLLGRIDRSEMAD